MLIGEAPGALSLEKIERPEGLSGVQAAFMRPCSYANRREPDGAAQKK
jgi:hypothetical protein